MRKILAAVFGRSASSMVIDFNIFEDSFPHMLSSHETLAVNGFDFERVNEALSAGIVVTVPSAAHAAPQAVLGEHGLIRGRAILTASVGMHGNTTHGSLCTRSAERH